MNILRKRNWGGAPQSVGGRFGCLLALLGGLSVLPARADVTLVYGEAVDTGETPAPTHQVHVREGGVSIANAVDKRLLIFDAAAGLITVVDHGSRRKTSLDDDGIRRLAAKFAEAQQKTLAQIEEKLAKLPKEEREVLRETVDMLHAVNVSPEKLAAPVYRYEDTGKKEEFLKIPAAEATLFRGDQPESLALLATREASGLSESDHAALRGLQDHLERLTKVLPTYMRSWLGSQGMLSGDGRLALRIVRGGDPANGGGRRMELLRIDHEPLEAGWFAVPEDYAAIRLDEFVDEVSGAPKSENVSEK